MCGFLVSNETLKVTYMYVDALLVHPQWLLVGRVNNNKLLGGLSIVKCVAWMQLIIIKLERLSNHSSRVTNETLVKFLQMNLYLTCEKKYI